jgi:raffinose/stachyose/melibiose transport system permease protein
VNRPLARWGLGGVAVLASVVVFLVPFAFIVLTAVMDARQAGEFALAWPRTFDLVQNFTTVLQTRD